jgi:hypothetical protein
MEKGSGGAAQGWEELARESRARFRWAFARASRSTPSGKESKLGVGNILSGKAASKLQKELKTSDRTASCGPWCASIRKKIIGHRMRSVAAGFRGGKRFWGSRGTLPLLHKPARQHGGGVFFQPLIQHGRNFLAEIGGMGETGQFKTLQRVPGSGKKELPWGLRGTGDHETSDKETMRTIGGK